MRIFLTACMLLALTACGGGSSNSSPPVAAPVASTLSFPLLQGQRRFNANGGTITLTSTGSAATEATLGYCSGTLSETDNPPVTSTTFEGVAALSGASSAVVNYSNCTPSSAAVTATSYYSPAYDSLGESTSTSYGVYSSLNIPVNVSVGNTAVVGTENVYTDSSKAVQKSHRDISIIVEADTASTAIINIVARSYWEHGVSGYACNTYNGSLVSASSPSVLYGTSQTRYRMDALGNMTLISIDYQYLTTCAYPSDGSSQHHFLWKA